MLSVLLMVVMILLTNIKFSSSNYEILGIKIGFKMGVLGYKSDNLHPYRVGSIDKGLYLEAVSAING